MPHVATQTRKFLRKTWSRIQKDIEELRRLKNMRNVDKWKKTKHQERKQAKKETAGATKRVINFRPCLLIKRVKKIITKRNSWKGDLPEEVFQEAMATAEKEKRGRRTQVVVKNEAVTSANATSSISADAASSSPSAVPPPRFKVEITWSDDKVGDKVGDGDRWCV